MPLADRSEVDSDAFPSSIDGDWDNPSDNQLNALSWFTGGHVQGSGVDQHHLMNSNTGTYANDTYSTVTVQAHGGGAGGGDFDFIGASTRHAAATTDASSYQMEVVSTNTVIAVGYRLWEWAGNGTRASLATAGTDHDLAAGDTVTIEAVGDQIEGFTKEGAGSDSSVVGPVTDATLTSGRPGIYVNAEVSAAQARVTAWSGGDIVAAAGIPALVMAPYVPV